MATEKVAINLDEFRSVRVEAETRYIGTRIVSGKNYSDYIVTYKGIEMKGEWNNDARQLTQCECPDSLRAEISAQWAKEDKAARERELASMSKSDREYFRSMGR